MSPLVNSLSSLAVAMEVHRRQFDASMAFCTDYPDNMQSAAWQGLRERYAEFRARSGDGAIVPKIIHQIWCGGDLPRHYNKFVRLMRRVNHDMEYRFWDGNKLDFEPVTGDLLQRVSNPGQMSDILRFEILNHYGGVYVDMDFVAVRPFATLLPAKFFTGIVFSRQPSLMNGLVGSVPGHPMVREVLRRMRVSDNPSDFNDIMTATGPFLMTRVFMDFYRDMPGSVALPVAYFCPFPNHPVYRTRGDNYRKYIVPETVCVHLWHCSWMKRLNASRPDLLRRIRDFLHV